MEAQPGRGLLITPMDIGEVPDSGFALARRNFRLLATIAAWGLVPGYALQVLLTVPFYIGAEPTGGSAFGGLVGVGGGLISAIAIWLATVAVMTACARLVAPYGAELPTPGWAYREAVSRVPSFILLGIIVALCSIPLVFLFFAPAVWLWVRWSPAFAAIIVERTGPISSLGRGWSLTRGAWWHTAMVLFVSALAVAVVEIATGGVFGAPVIVLALTVNAMGLTAVLSAIINALVVIIATPFSAAVAIVLYYELRARAEGFDLEQRLLQLAPAE